MSAKTCVAKTPEYLPSTTKLRRLFLHLSVSYSVHRGGEPGQVPPPGPGTSPRAGTPPRQVHCLPSRYTPGRYTPQDQVYPPGPGTPPRTRCTPRRRLLLRTVRILLECILVLLIILRSRWRVVFGTLEYLGRNLKNMSQYWQFTANFDGIMKIHIFSKYSIKFNKFNVSMFTCNCI